jgi:protein-tyrosine phosphatase
MIDFHNHVLPCIDDGAKTLRMSLRMLRHASEQGITDVVNTVHYQHPKVEAEDISYKRITNAIADLQKELIKNSIPINLHIGAEVFYLPNLLEIKNDPLASFIHHNYMLIEFQTHQLPLSQRDQLFNLKLSGTTPIIAHPERYKFVQEDINHITRWMESGCIIMVDAGSPLGFFGEKCKIASERIIKNGWCHILGSDSHDDNKRNFCLKESVDYVKKWIGDDVYKMVYDNPKSVIEGSNISVDFDYEESENLSIFNRIKSKWDSLN